MFVESYIVLVGIDRNGNRNCFYRTMFYRIGWLGMVYL